MAPPILARPGAAEQEDKVVGPEVQFNLLGYDRSRSPRRLGSQKLAEGDILPSPSVTFSVRPAHCGFRGQAAHAQIPAAPLTGMLSWARYFLSISQVLSVKRGH